MNLLYVVIAYGITVIALALMAVRTRQLIGIYKKGQPDPTRSNDRGKRLRMAAGEIFGPVSYTHLTLPTKRIV